MSSIRLRPILLALVALTAVAMIWPRVSKAEAKTAATEGAVGQSAVSATNTASGGTEHGIPAAQAKQHIGETNTVCGLVASTRYMESSKTKPTLLNFDRPFPDNTFSVMIPDADRGKFTGPPEMMFEGKTVCVTGLIIDFRGKPEIVVSDPSQIVASATTEAASSKTATNAVPKTPMPTKTP
jgi:DNA/RNA endonuclease YhcR with UshA esterase domain